MVDRFILRHYRCEKLNQWNSPMRSQSIVEESAKILTTGGGGLVIFKMTIVEFGTLFASLMTGLYFLVAALHVVWKWARERNNGKPTN